MKSLLLLALGSVILAGCNADQSETRDNSGQLVAEGEVLGGSISDEMIPIEKLRSQSRNLRAAPEPDQEEQDVGDLFDAVVAGEEDAAPQPDAPPAPSEPATPPAVEPAQ